MTIQLALDITRAIPHYKEVFFDYATLVPTTVCIIVYSNSPIKNFFDSPQCDFFSCRACTNIHQRRKQVYTHCTVYYTHILKGVTQGENLHNIYRQYCIIVTYTLHNTTSKKPFCHTKIFCITNFGKVTSLYDILFDYE